MLKHPDCYRPIIAMLALMLIGACASSTDNLSPPTAPTPVPTDPDTNPLVQKSRYTLVELRPESAQRELQRQIIDLRIPATSESTVGDALRYMLLRSGYRLCEGNPALTALWALPLPTAHLRLGPMELRQALQLLVGGGWRLAVDEQTRQVCFVAAPHPSAPLRDQP